MRKAKTSMWTRAVALVLTLICVIGVLPCSAFAVGDTETIKLKRFGMSGVSYQSAALGKCTIHQMYYDYGGNTSIGFCGEKGKGMGQSLIGQTWGYQSEISDPTVKMMMAYYYAHSTGVFTDAAVAAGVNTIWDAGYTWYMNAWVQAIVWRYKEGTLGNPVQACAEELMYVWNSLEGKGYTSIDQKHEGQSFRDRAQYIIDLGNQGIWGDCTVKEYKFTGAGSSHHPSNTVQSVIIGDLLPDEPEEQYTLIVKKVDSTNPTKGLPGAKFHIESTNGSYSKDIVTGANGTYMLRPMEAGTYAVTEVEAPNGYQIDNAGPEYVVLPSNGSSTVTVTFTDTPEITGTGSIRKVDADNPGVGLAGAVIKIEGVDNNFVGTYTTGQGGALNDVPWDTMPIGSYTATEITPPEGYDLSKDPNKVKQAFYWDGKTTVSLVFENDARVKVKLIKKDASEHPLPGAVFNIMKDGQLIGSEETNENGEITVTNVSEGMYAFVEVHAPAGYACLQEPVFAHVDQATISGGGTVTVTAVDKLLPNLTIQKLDAQTKKPIANTVFALRGIHFDYHAEAKTDAQGKAVLTGLPVDSYEVTEKSVPAPYVLGKETVKTIYLGPGYNGELIFENYQEPFLTIKKIDAVDHTAVPGTVFEVKGLDSDYKHDWTTGEDGTVKMQIAPGTYQIAEKSVPAPYYLPDKDKERVQEISLNPGDNKEILFRNHKMPQLTIFKEDSVAGAPIEGAKFHVVYTSNGESAEAPSTMDFGYFYSDSKGEIRLHEAGKRLYPGEYTVTEVAPAPGFQMKEPLVQKVILHGSESKTLTFQNEPLNAIIVEKYDSVTHEALPGCTFQLKYLGGTSGTGGTIIGQKVTGRNGTAIWTSLKAGTYIVEEIDPADGYNIIQFSETIYLQDTGVQSVVTVRFENLPDGVLLVRKVCSVNPSITLKNAEFKITYADGTLIGDANGIYRTDENGEIRVEGLTPGKSVIVTETKAPDGYIIDSQSQTIQIKGGKVNVVTMKNTPKGELIIQKRDSVTDKPLPGAEFRLTTAAGCEVGLDGVIGDSTLTQNGIFTTDAQGEIHIYGLIPGAYVITEIKAPNGYKIDQPSTNVVIGGKGDTQTIIIKNSPLASLVVKKMDASTKAPLADAIFKITTVDGAVVGSSNGEFRTDERGYIVVNGLKPGSYKVCEAKAPAGYILDNTTKTIQIDDHKTYELEFFNQPQGSLIVHKLDALTREPLEGVEFKITYADGKVVDADHGQLSSNGMYRTNKEGQIVINGLVGTVIVTEVKTIPGYMIDEAARSQTVVINPNDTQTLTFYNRPVGGLQIIKSDKDTGERIPGVKFEVREMNGKIVGTYTTDRNGVIHLPQAKSGWYTVVEREAAAGYELDVTPQQIEVKDGETATLEITNTRMCSIMIHKIDSATREGIYGAKFILYDAGKNPIGEYSTDQDGYIYIRDELTAGKYYLRELDAADGYVRDEQYRTIYVERGKCTQVEWENHAIRGQIQIIKKSANDNPINGLPAGTLLEGAVFEIYDKAGNKVDTIKTDYRGRAVSRQLPLSRYTIREVQAPQFYSINPTVMTAYLEHEGQIVTFEVSNDSVATGVSIKKTGYHQVMPGQPIKYTLTQIGNTSTIPLSSFYWRDALPAQVTMTKLITGTYNQPLSYKIVYKTNLSSEYRTLADNLSTLKNYALETRPAALGLAANERITEFMFVFGTVKPGFAQVETPYIYGNVRYGLANGSSFVNVADVGGLHNGQWVMGVSRWVTSVYAKTTARLPKTGY